MEMTPRNALLLGAAVAALVTGIVVAILLPPRTCGQVGNSFFNPRVICVGVPSWVRAVVVGTAAVIAVSWPRWLSAFIGRRDLAAKTTTKSLGGSDRWRSNAMWKI
jgi:hypothetical protein